MRVEVAFHHRLQIIGEIEKSAQEQAASRLIDSRMPCLVASSISVGVALRVIHRSHRTRGCFPGDGHGTRPQLQRPATTVWTGTTDQPRAAKSSAAGLGASAVIGPAHGRRTPTCAVIEVAGGAAERGHEWGLALAMHRQEGAGENRFREGVK